MDMIRLTKMKIQNYGQPAVAPVHAQSLGEDEIRTMLMGSGVLCPWHEARQHCRAPPAAIPGIMSRYLSSCSHMRHTALPKN